MLYAFELESYLEGLLPERPDLLQEMEHLALEETIPVVTPAVGNFLSILVLTQKPKAILEIGTAIGYSTVWLAQAAREVGCQVTTVDMNSGRRERALEFFRRAGLSEYIMSLAGDARKVLPTLAQTFDFVFIDAAKGEYLEYLELLHPLIAPGGMLVADNVLFRGWVVPGAVFDRKYEKMVQTVRAFLQHLSADPRFQTTVLPFGDGLAVSIKK
ncbi:O-methyltransferase [Paradesulfitobacterium ferrireducens]|uniref:O-methyltransferase n=1 Tax=Paradesulfitobacterium ferrireducens TaxID=2816476 RepID=UPI001A8C9C4F|nr:O-methyltransferase [Paradesulfitobacterium ferrireducens]